MNVRARMVDMVLYPNITVSKVWDFGHKEMDTAYNQTTQRGIDFSYLIDPDLAFFFVGGRSSLIKFFELNQNSRTFIAAPGSSLGIIVDRKKSHFQKDKTMIGICNIGLRSNFTVQPAKSFNGKMGVLPLPSDGSYLQSKQIASIIRHIYFNPVQEGRTVKGLLQFSGIY